VVNVGVLFSSVGAGLRFEFFKSYLGTRIVDDIKNDSVGGIVIKI